MSINRIYKRNLMQQITGYRELSHARIKRFRDTIKQIEDTNKERIKKNLGEAKNGRV